MPVQEKSFLFPKAPVPKSSYQAQQTNIRQRLGESRAAFCFAVAFAVTAMAGGLCHDSRVPGNGAANTTQILCTNNWRPRLDHAGRVISSSV